MLNADRTATRLSDLLGTEQWRNRFTTIADTTGFMLSVYSTGGDRLFSTREVHPLCRALRSSSAEQQARCDSFCSGARVATRDEGTSRVYTCNAGVVSFSLPVRYLGEMAVIVGQGSFADYRGFRGFTDKLRSAGADGLSVTGPLRFTSADQAFLACSLVDGTVNELLRNTQENISLRHRIEGLKTVMTGWGSAGREDPEGLHERLLHSLFMLLDLPHVALLTSDRQQQGVFASRSSLRKQGVGGASLTLSRDDDIVQALQGGAPFITVPDAVARFGTSFADPGSLFPLVVGRTLEGIVAVFGAALRESDIQAITIFCRQTALAIENHHLHHDLYRKFDRFAAIAELTQAITPIQSYDSLLQTILEKSADLLAAEQGSLMLLDQDTDALLLEATKGIMEDPSDTLSIPRGEGIAGRVAALGEPLLVENVEDDPRVRKKNRHRYKTLSFVSVPLKLEDRIIGVLNLSDKTSGDVFNEEDLRIIQCFATHAAVVLDRNALYSQTEKLKKLSITDHLTGLLNRRYLLDRLEEELSRSRRHSRHMSVVMLDLDGFKHYNDTYGHIAGDRALKMIADIILNAVRSMDVVSRYGGDEFMLILPETDTALATNIAERLRADVERAPLPERDGDGRALGLITASIGIACYPEHGNMVDLLIDRVDRALYRAKEKGRNRVEVYS
jgi:diguanylate cyclase (GGDEF)-like protein